MFLLTLLALVLAPTDTLVTVAEATDFRATSRYADVVEFVERVAEHPALHATTFGESVEGRALPLVVIGADDATPEAVHGAETLRVLVFANIHAGEVAGKEAALMLLRAIAAGRHDDWFDRVTLLVAPIYNADGNERIDPRNRPLQHGPVDGMGTRTNAMELDLNRDFEKVDAPETRALISVMNDYDPHVVVDLHTTNGTTHAYHLTYAPPLHPLTPEPIDAYLNDRWLPALQTAMRDRWGFETFLYGNDKPEWGQPPGWTTFDPRPRFGTNYVGVRGRFAILSEAYSYASFEERVRASLAFTEAILDYAHEYAGEIAALVAEADAETLPGRLLPTRALHTYDPQSPEGTVLMGGVTVEENPHTGEPMWLRTDERREVTMPLLLRYVGSHPSAMPRAYLVPEGETDVLDRLAAHGIRTEPASDFAADEQGRVEAFAVRGVATADRPFQGHTPRVVDGAWVEAAWPGDGYRLVPMDQPLARLAFLLLEPMSDSGFAHWGLVEARSGEAFPVMRLR